MRVSEAFAPQLFIIQSAQDGMETNPKYRRPQFREDIIKELEQFSVEVLETTLMVLRMRQSKSEQ